MSAIGNQPYQGVISAGNILDGAVTAAKLAAGVALASGTVGLFVQSTAPVGWTKSTAHDNKALRVVSGTAGSGGSVAFTTAFASQAVSGTVGSTTLSEAQIPNHTHNPLSGINGDRIGQTGGPSGGWGLNNGTNNAIHQMYNSYTGGSQPHNHTFSGTAINLAVQYVDIILATKD